MLLWYNNNVTDYLEVLMPRRVYVKNLYTAGGRCPGGGGAGIIIRHHQLQSRIGAPYMQ